MTRSWGGNGNQTGAVQTKASVAYGTLATALEAAACRSLSSRFSSTHMPRVVILTLLLIFRGARGCTAHAILFDNVFFYSQLDLENSALGPECRLKTC